MTYFLVYTLERSIQFQIFLNKNHGSGSCHKTSILFLLGLSTPWLEEFLAELWILQSPTEGMLPQSQDSCPTEVLCNIFSYLAEAIE